MKTKGMTGKILTIILSLVLGLASLAVLWYFLTKSTTLINASTQKIVTGVRCKIFCYEINFFNIGSKKIGMCAGC